MNCVLLKLQATVDFSEEEVDMEAPPTGENTAASPSSESTLRQESLTSREPAAAATHESSEAISVNLERTRSQESLAQDEREEKPIMLHNDLGSSNYELTQF